MSNTESHRVIEVMIVTDHPIMQEGLRILVQQETDMCVVCEASDASRTLQDFNECDPDVVLIDLQLPRGAGSGLVNAIHRRSPSTPLVVLTSYPEETDHSTTPDEGRTLIISKDSAGAEVIPAIRELVARSFF
jgi:DNA-binding NarL/FixJ family response regulator